MRRFKQGDRVRHRGPGCFRGCTGTVTHDQLTESAVEIVMDDDPSGEPGPWIPYYFDLMEDPPMKTRTVVSALMTLILLTLTACVDGASPTGPESPCDEFRQDILTGKFVCVVKVGEWSRPDSAAADSTSGGEDG